MADYISNGDTKRKSIHSLKQRIILFEKIDSILSKILPEESCYRPDQSEEEIVNETKKNISYYFEISPYLLGEGFYNEIRRLSLRGRFKDMIPNEMGKDLILRIIKGNNKRLICNGIYYTLLFSNVVKQGICPNFCLTCGPYFCNKDEAPMIIQEMYDYTLEGAFRDYTISETDLINIFIQLVFAVGVSDKLKLSHNDFYLNNLMVKKLSTSTTVQYIFADISLIVDIQYLGAIIDFDMMNDTVSLRDIKYLLSLSPPNRPQFTKFIYSIKFYTEPITYYDILNVIVKKYKENYRQSENIIEKVYNINFIPSEIYPIYESLDECRNPPKDEFIFAP